MSKAIYRWKLDCGRMGQLAGIFVAEDANVHKAAGKRWYQTDILGKHSEIEGRLEVKEFERLTDDPVFVETFARLKCATGHNPLEWVEWEGEEESAAMPG